MFIFPLTLSEASGTFVGLEAQALIRSALGPAPALVILSGAAFIGLGMIRGHRRLVDLAFYLFASLLTLSLIWPASSSVSPSDVQSQAASGQAIQDASGLLPGRAGLQIPRVEVELLRAISGMWVNVARAINSDGDRPFSEVAPISWLMRQGLSGEATALIREWTSACVMPARKRLLDRGGGANSEELLPFPGSALHGVMGDITVQMGNDFILCGPQSDVIMTVARTEVEGFLSPGGNSMSQIWSSELSIAPAEVVKFLIMREVRRASGPEIQPVSLTGLYATMRVITSMSGGIKDAAIGTLNLQGGDVLAGLGSALTGGVSSAVSDLAVSVQALVGKALFVTKFSSDIVGVLQAVILAVFPFVALVALTPGKHILTLVSYVYLLVAIYSMPFAWALVDLLSDIALSQAGSLTLVTNPVVTLEAMASALIIVTIGTWVALFGLAFAILLPIAGGASMVIRGARGV